MRKSLKFLPPIMVITIVLIGVFTAPVSALCGTAYCGGTCPAPVSGTAPAITPTSKADIVLNNGAEDAGTLTALSGNAYSNQPADVETPTSEVDAVTRILARSTSLGRSVEVMIANHADLPGSQWISPGGTSVLSDNNAQVQDFVSKLNGKLSSLHLFGCSVASGAAGKALLDTLFSGLGGILVDGYDNTVYWPTDSNCDGTHFCTFGNRVVGSSNIGGFIVPVDKLALLAPYIGFASVILAGGFAIFYAGRLKRHRKPSEG